MAEGLFSIFPDTSAVIGHGLKGAPQTFRKKALRDVKNTLQATKNVAGKPVGKLNSGNALAPSCNPPAKDLCASATPKTALKEAFKIKSDSVDELDSDYCSCEEQFDDFLWTIRPTSECFQDEDINYLKDGILGCFRPDIDFQPCDDYVPIYTHFDVDVQPYFPPLSPLGPLIHISDSDSDEQ